MQPCSFASGLHGRIMKEIKRYCETCKFWKKGDLSAKNIGNVGQCTFFMVQTRGFYDNNPKVPFWADKITFQTVGWEGDHCSTYQKASQSKIKTNQAW